MVPMAESEQLASMISKFVDENTINSVRNFTSTDNLDNDDVDSIAKMFGYTGSFSSSSSDSKMKIITNFKNNLRLLIQKTWVEKSDVILKEGILFQLDVLFKDTSDWKNSYKQFLDIIANSVCLMFGQQSKSDDFSEYSLRIDPEFGIFWWYIKSLPTNADWSCEKFENAVLLGMYFLANY